MRQTVLAVRGGTVVELQIGSRQARVNDRVVLLDVPARIIGARTLVPLRFVSEALGATVQWQEATRTVLIYTGAAAPPPGPAAARCCCTTVRPTGWPTSTWRC